MFLRGKHGESALLPIFLRESSPTTHSHTHKLCSKKSKLNFQLTTSQNARRRNVSQLPLQILHLVPHTSCRIPRLIQPLELLTFNLKNKANSPEGQTAPGQSQAWSRPLPLQLLPALSHFPSPSLPSPAALSPSLATTSLGPSGRPSGG